MKASHAERLLDLVISDASLPNDVHEQVEALRSLAYSSPNLIPSRLEHIRRELLPRLPSCPITCGYSRFIPARSFWEYVLDDPCRLRYNTFKDYWKSKGYDVGTHHVPDLTDLKLLVTLDPSWLVPVTGVDPSWDGATLQKRLHLDEARPPPYIRMDFSKKSLLRNDVELRRPNALDAAVGGHLKWRSGDVPDERVGTKLLATAITSVSLVL